MIVSALYILKPDIEVFLENTKEILKMGEKPGFRLHVGKTWEHNKKNSFSIAFITDYWEFGRSNTIFTNDFFGQSTFITEPRSESLHIGLEFSYAYHF